MRSSGWKAVCGSGGRRTSRYCHGRGGISEYENYFHVLGLPYDESKNEYYTSENEEEKINEQVKELYKKNINNIEKMLRGLEINEEIQKIKEEFIEKFQDAYSALKDRNSREHYIDLLKEIKDDKAENDNKYECKGGEEEWEK